jgi:hypothetical protein
VARSGLLLVDTAPTFALMDEYGLPEIANTASEAMAGTSAALELPPELVEEIFSCIDYRTCVRCDIGLTYSREFDEFENSLT